MKPLQVMSEIVILQGLSLRGSFVIRNPNNQLAIVYDFPARSVGTEQKNKEGKHLELQFFPKCGVLLKNEQEKISVCLKEPSQILRLNKNQEKEFQLVIKFHYSHNYNRLILNSSNLKSIDPIELFQKVSQVIIPLKINQEFLRIKHESEIEGKVSTILDKDTVNISKITLAQNQKQEQVLQDSIILSLKLESKCSHNEQAGQEFFPLYSVNSISKFQEEKSVIINTKRQNKPINSFELIILTILSAFFFGLGANLNNLMYK